MAQRRMFSKDITNSDEFVDMPLSSQALYFHLGMNADDDGFVPPKGIMRLVQAKDDDLKVLRAKGFVIPFKDSVIVLTHWKTNNEIKRDRYKPTIYQEHLKILGITSGKYEMDTKCLQNVSKMETQVRLGKDSIGKVSIDKDSLEIADKSADVINSLLKEFEEINPTINYGNKTQRKALEEMVTKFGEEKVRATIIYAVSISGQKYAPTITTPYQLKEKLGELIAFQKRESNKSNFVSI